VYVSSGVVTAAFIVNEGIVPGTVGQGILSPILEFPHVPAYLVMCGSTSGQEDALLVILSGQMAAEGGKPLPGLQP